MNFHRLHLVPLGVATSKSIKSMRQASLIAFGDLEQHIVSKGAKKRNRIAPISRGEIRHGDFQAGEQALGSFVSEFGLIGLD